MNKEQWHRIPARILKSELSKREISYKDLSKKLAAIGVDEKPENINSRISRGRDFSTVFFIQCLRAIGTKTIQLDDAFFECEEKN